MSRTLTFAGVEYHTPFVDLIRAHTDKERASLEASIRDAGVVLYSVITYDRLADAGGGLAVIDGATRLAIAGELGLKQVPILHLGAKTEAEAESLCITANVDRRQLSVTEQQAARKKRIALAVDLKESGLSIRDIAKGLGVSKTQVVADLSAGATSLGTSDNGVQGCTPPDPDLKVLNALIASNRRSLRLQGELLKTKLAKLANQFFGSHNAECALESYDAALADLSVQAIQGIDDPDDDD